MTQHSKKVTSLPESNVVPADEVIHVPIKYEVVVDSIAIGPFDGGLKPLEAAMLVIANQHGKLAEEANGTYRFELPGLGDFVVDFDYKSNEPSLEETAASLGIDLSPGKP